MFIAITLFTSHRSVFDQGLQNPNSIADNNSGSFFQFTGLIIIFRKFLIVLLGLANLPQASLRNKNRYFLRLRSSLIFKNNPMFFTASMLSTEASVSFTEPNNSNKPNLTLFKSPNLHMFLILLTRIFQNNKCINTKDVYVSLS